MAVPEYTEDRLVIIGWIERYVHHDHMVSSNQIDTHPGRARGQ